MKKKEFLEKKKSRLLALKEMISIKEEAAEKQAKHLKEVGRYNRWRYDPKNCAPELTSEFLKLTKMNYCEAIAELPSSLDDSLLVSEALRVIDGPRTDPAFVLPRKPRRIVEPSSTNVVNPDYKSCIIDEKFILKRAIELAKRDRREANERYKSIIKSLKSRCGFRHFIKSKIASWFKNKFK